MTNFLAHPNGHIQGEITVPGDKSISHRSIMFASLATGTSHIQGFLQGEDAMATLAAFRQMGVDISGPDEEGNVVINGVGMHGLKVPLTGALNLGNSGTSMRLLMGLLSGQQFNLQLTGDHSLSGRPMMRVAKPLGMMGAKFHTTERGTAPIDILNDERKTSLQSIHFDMPIASAQVKSAILLAGMYAEGKTEVIEPAPTRDHSERMLQGFSYPLEIERLEHGCSKIIIEGGHALTAIDLTIPADISSAAFFMVAACITPAAELLLKNVGVNPTRIGIVNILRDMGASIELTNQRMSGGEPVADIFVKESHLHGINIPPGQVPLAIDEFPIIAIAAACASGKTILTGAEELRVKESDRIQAMVDGLQILGVNCQGTEDGMIIEGGEISGGTVDSMTDHRIAMSFAIASLRANQAITILNTENVNTSFPGFVDLANQLGMDIEFA